MLKACELFSDSDIFWGAGKKEQEVLLGACNCSIDICYSVHLFCVYNPCRKERRWNCKLFHHSSPLVFKEKIVGSDRNGNDTNEFYWYVKVRHIEKGINPPSLNEIYFTGKYLEKGFRIGVVAGMIALTVSHSTTRLLSSRDLIIDSCIWANFLVSLVGAILSGSHSDW